MEVVLVVPVIAREDVDVLVVLDTRVRVARCGRVALCMVHLRPRAVHGVVLPKVVHAVVAVVAAEYVERVLESHDYMPVPSARRVSRVDLAPL